ncbi:MAG: PilZ domain-containing protein [Thermodesulfobacteriota bacterium]|nr:PilZ domain-containing protein [Thermodesulfobacteriota bacterium]
MPDKRRKVRIRRRVRTMYGSEIPSKVGFTSDISESGICIKSFMVYNPGDILLIEIETSDGQFIRFEGRVHWSRRVPPNLLRKVKHAGMGVKIVNFINGQDLYLNMCRERQK